jgi:adenine deaminase
MRSKRGVRPLLALALVSINPANYFHLRDRGAIAPGRIADIVQIGSLEECRPLKVWKRGVLVAEGGRALFETPRPDISGLPGAQLSAFSEIPSVVEKLKVKAEVDKKIRGMELIPGKVITGQLILELLIQGNEVVPDVERDILKIVVVEKIAAAAISPLVLCVVSISRRAPLLRPWRMMRTTILQWGLMTIQYSQIWSFW